MPCFLHCVTWLGTMSTLLGALTLHTQTAKLYTGVFLFWKLSRLGQPFPSSLHLPCILPSPVQESSPVWAGPTELPITECCRILGTHPTAQTTRCSPDDLEITCEET